ncbi:chemotaxis response regulator protein-glutamate methylesterase [Rhodoferax lithotrophicus]|uniref:Chemotaxis response regulator protein-glutamate methylesterase n=1 Tax=Rhodoferax lithotrophicus TaxID=2798804 RepID=A0ABM7MMM6_9BURK|nr:EAL domain-containing protein [Rhodoferax sp. MIZ03]BCO27523.1 chemotaxis response regulator protein-glutamate methylesterase [Rhodoferax sp. MIZ03]
MLNPKPLILAIDDSPANLLTLGMALEPDFELQIATSGAMGLTLALEMPPDLILLDIMMPDMDGFETCRQIKAHVLLKDIPVVFVSALTEIESESKGLALGAADFITKPINVEIARQRIHNLLERDALRKDVIAQRNQLKSRLDELDQTKNELLHSQSTLIQSEALKRTILNSLVAEIVVIDRTGVILAVNKPWIRFANENRLVNGALPTSIDIGSNYIEVCQRVCDLSSPDAGGARQALTGIHDVLEGHLPTFSMEYPCHSPTQQRWFKMRVSPLGIEARGGAVISHTDISERKEMELRLRESESHLRAIIFNEPECIKIVDAEGLLTQMNPAGLKMIEADDQEQVVGKPVQDLIAPEYREAFYKMHQRVLAGESVEMEFEVLGLKGGRRWLETHAVPMQTGHQTVQLAVTRDVTSRKQTEQAFKQQLQFGQALNLLAQTILENDDDATILQATTRVVGQTLSLDRVLIYQVSFDKQLVTGLCEWLNPLQTELTSSLGSYPLSFFIGADLALQRSKQAIISHFDDVSPHLQADGSAHMLHQKLHIKSLLWYPFNFDETGYSLLVLNQVFNLRHWSGQELDFLDALSRQVNMALHKIKLIERQKKADEKIHLAASVFSHAREGIFIAKLDGRIVDVNNAFTRITGYQREEVLGQNPRIWSSGRQGIEFYNNMWQQLSQKGHWYGELWNRRKNGDFFAEMLTISAVRDAHGAPEHYVALFSDITDIKEHQEQLDHIAHFDALTNLPNRVLLADRLHQGMLQEQRRGKKLAVVFLDLDGFKTVNDTHGHEAGDQLLISLASRMKQSLREGDTLARIGGDEFVAVIGELDDAQASVPMLRRLLSAASQPLMVDHKVLQVSASLGVTVYPQDQELDADQLLRQADQAMYQAKVSGKNRYSFFDAAQDNGIRSYHESIERMRQGLDNHEFVLFYQPKVNMRTGAVVGAEALIRWQHPQDGLMVPDLFLPVVENHPLAVELGEWVIHTALHQIESWQAQGLHLPVSVNVGARQLQQSGFVSRLQDILAEHPGVAPSSLGIEILETSALEDLVRVSQVIEDCRKLGVMFAMDDFGTGYSSLTYLRRLQVHMLKIDQSFVRNMLGDTDDLAILQGIIGLARSFRREAIAEGVETVAHGTLLLQLGCELAQGYGIAKPMPAHEMSNWVKSWHPATEWLMQRVIVQEALPVLYGRVEHRAWIAAMGAHLRGESLAPPPLDARQCHFGQWLNGPGKDHFHRVPMFGRLEDLHQQVHTLATQMVAEQANGRNAQALAMLPELHGLRDTLLAQLDALLVYQCEN